MLKKRSVLLLIGLCFLLLFSACSNKAPADESSASGTGAATAPDKNLTIAISGDIGSFDAQNEGGILTQAVLVNMFDGLLRRDQNGQYQPNLAESYKQIDDVTWQFKLRSGVTFQNGDPLTSEDVKFSFDRIVNDKTMASHTSVETVKEVKIIDDLTLNIITASPDPLFLTRVSGAILPKAYLEKVGIEGFKEKPVGTGPYQFVEWKKDDKVVLKKYDHYFMGDVSDWENVVFRVIPEPSTRVSELLTGGVDLIEAIPPSEWDRVNNNEGTSVLPTPSPQTVLLIVNHRKDLVTSNPKVVEAIDYAINDKAIADNLFKGMVTPTRTRSYPGIVGYNKDLYNTFRYDPEKAKALLKEAGFESGLELNLQGPRGRYLLDAEVVQLVAGMLEQVGIKVKMEIFENTRYAQIRDSNQNRELMLAGYGIGNDLYYAVNNYHSKVMPQRIAYHNPEVDELIDKAQFNMNEEERLQQLTKVDQIAAEEMPYIPMYNDKEFLGISDKIEFKSRGDKMFFVVDITRKP